MKKEKKIKKRIKKRKETLPRISLIYIIRLLRASSSLSKHVTELD